MMEHPYRVHSSIGFGFLQLLFISSIAYPSPPPPVYHNIAVMRLMATVYFTIFQDKPFYLKLECLTILIEAISDALYVRYIIKDYTYIFGVLDICSNLLFFIFVVISLKNGNDTETETKEIRQKLDDIRKTCISCCFGLSPSEKTHEDPLRNLERPEHHTTNPRTNNHLYKSIPSEDYRKNTNHHNHANQDDKAPVYTFGGRQAFKPSFYSSSWGREYIQASVEREFDKIDKHYTELGDVGMISGTDGTTQYIRFDEHNYGSSASDVGISNYASIFVTPYFTKDGTQITGCTNIDKIGVCLFIYNIIQFIYQLMIYSSIIVSCREHNLIPNNSTTFQIENWLC